MNYPEITKRLIAVRKEIQDELLSLPKSNLKIVTYNVKTEYGYITISIIE